MRLDMKFRILPVAVASTGTLIATEASAATAHGVTQPSPEASPFQIALFVLAAIAVFFVRRLLRKRFGKRPPRDRLPRKD